jgi:nicotinamidase-related amidase
MNKYLLVIDMQKAFIEEVERDEKVGKINKLIESKEYKNIFYLIFKPLPGNYLLNKFNLSKLTIQENLEIVVNIKHGSKIFEKQGFGKCDELIKYLKNNNIKEIDLCGMDTEVCVTGVWYNLIDNEIMPNILYNYCFTDNEHEEYHRNQMKLFKNRLFNTVDYKE